VPIPLSVKTTFSLITMGKGDSFDLVLADGTVLNIEQTADDFSIVAADGKVIYSQAISNSAKLDNGYKELVDVLSDPNTSEEDRLMTLRTLRGKATT
jgi:hypothetical protein